MSGVTGWVVCIASGMCTVAVWIIMVFMMRIAAMMTRIAAMMTRGGY